jgi:hypothetical protein
MTGREVADDIPRGAQRSLEVLGREVNKGSRGSGGPTFDEHGRPAGWKGASPETVGNMTNRDDGRAAQKILREHGLHTTSEHARSLLEEIMYRD